MRAVAGHDGVGDEAQPWPNHRVAACAASSTFDALSPAHATTPSGRTSTVRHPGRSFASLARTRLDPAAYPFVCKVAAQLAARDEREQLVAGIDVILKGTGSARFASSRWPVAPARPLVYSSSRNASASDSTVVRDSKAVANRCS
ncbi:hypothetical protein K6W38_31305 [Burkholderia contaminans]|nr:MULTISPECIES: hypothetical protein [Burkholderia]MBY4727623.1 hypothetical protein [Burkholderia contaminans]